MHAGSLEAIHPCSIFLTVIIIFTVAPDLVQKLEKLTTLSNGAPTHSVSKWPAFDS